MKISRKKIIRKIFFKKIFLWRWRWRRGRGVLRYSYISIIIKRYIDLKPFDTRLEFIKVDSIDKWNLFILIGKGPKGKFLEFYYYYYYYYLIHWILSSVVFPGVQPVQSAGTTSVCETIVEEERKKKINK